MLPARNRLQKKNDIERVFKYGRSFFVESLGIRVAPNKLKNSRFTVVTSLKISKKAAYRNKLKRQLREIIRQDILPSAKPGFDGVILTNKELLDVPYTELQERALKLFRKSGLLTPHG